MSKKKKKEKLVIHRLVVNDKVIAQELGIDLEKTRETFRDGRPCSRFTEHWVDAIYGVDIYKNACVKSSDGIIECAGDVKFLVSVKCLTRGSRIKSTSKYRGSLKFQNSAFIGAGRTCTDSDVKNSIRNCDRVCICDIREFPVLSFIMLDTKLIEDWFDQGFVKKSGINGINFYKLLSEKFKIQEYFYKPVDGKIQITDETLAPPIEEITYNSQDSLF